MGGLWKLGLIAILCRVAPAQEKVVPEYRLKAFLLSNFSSATSMEWPARAFAAADDPFVVGVVGEDPFKEELEAAFRELKPQGHPVKLVRYALPADLKGCHLLFIPAASKPKAAELLDQVKGSPTVVVGESPGFAAAGGGLNLIAEDGRLKFELNPDSLSRAGVTARARFLQLAKIVKDEK